MKVDRAIVLAGELLGLGRNSGLEVDVDTAVCVWADRVYLSCSIVFVFLSFCWCYQ